jgi:uncharacterized membrane protein YkvI
MNIYTSKSNSSILYPVYIIYLLLLFNDAFKEFKNNRQSWKKKEQQWLWNKLLFQYMSARQVSSDHDLMFMIYWFSKVQPVIRTVFPLLYNLGSLYLVNTFLMEAHFQICLYVNDRSDNNVPFLLDILSEFSLNIFWHVSKLFSIRGHNDLS